jgi:hypothetical protein
MNNMNAYLITEDNGYDGIGKVWVVAAKDEPTATAYIAKRYGIAMKYLATDIVLYVTVSAHITETTIISD